MAAEAEAEREAKVKLIAAEGEMKASKALKEAADVMNENPAALQVISLKELYRVTQYFIHETMDTFFKFCIYFFLSV